MAEKKPVSIILRIEAGLHANAKKLAKKKFISLNGLINSAIEKEIKKDDKNNLVVSK